jgi:hypothetical protein
VTGQKSHPGPEVNTFISSIIQMASPVLRVKRERVLNNLQRIKLTVEISSGEIWFLEISESYCWPNSTGTVNILYGLIRG